jgi:hypothetical protein
MTCEVSWAYTLSSRGGGTNYHYDKGDDGEVLLSDAHTQTDDQCSRVLRHPYLVLTTPDWLLLPDIGYRI